MSTEYDPLRRQLDENGYVLLPGVISREEASGYTKRLNEVYARLKVEGSNLYPGGLGASERLILNLHNKDEAFIELTDHPALLPLMQHLLMTGSYQNSEPFIITQFSARDPQIGSGAQQLHMDSRFPGPPFALMGIALWMLNDFTLASGATRLVPGSHRRVGYPADGGTYPDEVIAEAPAGSLLIYNASAWHGSGAKAIDVERWAVIVSYARWFVKPAFDMTQNTPPDLYARLSPGRRELFGFTCTPPHDEMLRARSRIQREELLPDLRAWQAAQRSDRPGARRSPGGKAAAAARTRPR